MGVTSVEPSKKPPTADFSICLVFDEGITAEQQEAFKAARNRWLNIIKRGGDPVTDSSGDTYVLKVTVKLDEIDGDGGLGAETIIDESSLRPAGEAGAYLPSRATIRLDARDVAQHLDAIPDAALRTRLLKDLATHELGHALGFSRVVWDRQRLIVRNGGPKFVGPLASAKYQELRAPDEVDSVPLEDFVATSDEPDGLISHWDQAFFKSELMTAILDEEPNEISSVTVAALRDMGYYVAEKAAETFNLDINQPQVGSDTGDTGPRSFESAEASPVARVSLPAIWLHCRVRLT